MFENIAVHVAEGCELDRVWDCIESVTGERLKETTDSYNGKHFITDYNENFFTTFEDFSSNRFFDDAGIPFSRLPILVNFKPYRGPGAEERQNHCRELILRVAARIFADLKCDCVVAEDMARLVKTFKSPENDWL
jgi:hypothetical protein